MSALETIYDYFEDHAQAAHYVQETRPVLFGVFCFALGALSLFMAQAMTQRLILLPFNFPSLAFFMLWRVAAGFLMAAVLHMIMEFSGAKGSAATLFVLLGMATLIWALAIPLILISRFLWPQSHWPVTIIFAGVGLLGLSLKARGIQDTYHVGASRAWFTLLLPYFAVVVAAGIALSVAFWLAILKVMQWAG